MNQKLQETFYKRWPTFFDRVNPPYKGGFYGFECDDGWFNILWTLCENIEKTLPDENFKVLQVKEKFGGLRFYVCGSHLKISELIHQAEIEAYRTCEICSIKNEQIRSSPIGWMKNLCLTCAIKRWPEKYNEERYNTNETWYS